MLLSPEGSESLEWEGGSTLLADDGEGDEEANVILLNEDIFKLKLVRALLTMILVYWPGLVLSTSSWRRSFQGSSTLLRKSPTSQ